MLNLGVRKRYFSKMKNLKIFGVFVFGVLILGSCGSSKTVPMTGPTKVKLALDECQELAQQKPAIRAWGEGINFGLSEATEYAELSARSKFARAIASAVKTAQSTDNASYRKSSSDGQNGSTVRDEGAKQNSMSISIAEEVVKNAVIIKTSQYQQIDGSYQVFVCLEYQAGVGQLAKDLTKKVDQQISNEERMKMNFEFEKFRQRVEEELNKSKAQ